MAEFISSLIQWLNAHPEMSGLVTFLISAGESVAILGTIVPGSIMMTALGTLAGANIIPLWETLFCAILGAIAGDGISYWMGHHFGPRLPRIWPFRRYPGILKSGEEFVGKYGAMSVFIGRFIGPVRALVPLVAGMLGMRPLTFTIANVISAIGWAPAYMLPGILLGAASLELPPDIAVHVILVLMLFGLFAIFCLWSIYRLLRLYHYQTEQLQDWIWSRLVKSRTLAPLTSVLKHPNPQYTHGQLNLAFYCLLAITLLFALIIDVHLIPAAQISINDAIFHLFRGLRTNIADEIMLRITVIGQKYIMLLFTGVICLILLSYGRIRATLHVLAAYIFTAGAIFSLKHLIQVPRPPGLLVTASTFSMPSGHAALVTTILIGFTCIISYSLPQRSRWRVIIYSIAIITVGIIGISRLYLGVHWLTDVISGWLLGSAILLLIIISYRRKSEPPLPVLALLCGGILTLVIAPNIYYYHYQPVLKSIHTQVDWPTNTIDANQWWENNGQMPTYRVSLFGFPSQPINIEWQGDLATIKASLIQTGWTQPPARDYISTFHRLADIKSTQYLPMISPQYLDKRPVLILSKNKSDNGNLVVIRLWNSNRVVNTNNHPPIWVGTIAAVPRAYSWLKHKPTTDSFARAMSWLTHQAEFHHDIRLIFAGDQIKQAWEYKIIDLRMPKASTQRIVLIRARRR